MVVLGCSISIIRRESTNSTTYVYNFTNAWSLLVHSAKQPALDDKRKGGRELGEDAMGALDNCLELPEVSSLVVSPPLPMLSEKWIGKNQVIRLSRVDRAAPRL